MVMIVNLMEEDGGLLRDGEGLALGEAGEGGAGGEEGAKVVGVGGGQVVAVLDGLLDQAAPLLAASDGVLVVQLRGGASHCGTIAAAAASSLFVVVEFFFPQLLPLKLSLSFHISVCFSLWRGGRGLLLSHRFSL